jgi:phage-related tail protein
LKDAGILEIDIVENKITKTLLQFIDAINKILRDNKVIKNETEASKNKIEILFKEFIKL